MSDSNLTVALDAFLAQLTTWECPDNTDVPTLRAQRKEGLLSDDDLLGVVREVLFHKITAKRLPKLEDRDFCACVTQAVPLRGPRMPSRCEYGTSTNVKDVPPAQYAVLTKVRLQAPAGATVVLRRHHGRCNACGRSKERVGVLVTLNWHGRPLSREYALEER